MKLYDRSKPSNYKTRKVVQTTSAKAKDVARSTSKNVRDSAQDTFASAKDTVQLAYMQVQKSMKAGWYKALVWLTTRANTAGDFLQENTRKTQKNLKKAQKNLQKMQDPLQENIRSSLAKTSAVLSKGTSTAQYSLQQARTRAREMQEARQEQSAQRQRKRQRAKTVFRWGLISGVVLALLYSPIAGSEARRRISKGCQQSYAFFRNRKQAFQV